MVDGQLFVGHYQVKTHKQVKKDYQDKIPHIESMLESGLNNSARQVAKHGGKVEMLMVFIQILEKGGVPQCHLWPVGSTGAIEDKDPEFYLQEINQHQWPDCLPERPKRTPSKGCLVHPDFPGLRIEL
eukprot:TRINITY_DN108310_c0_g1_i1.p1 TRINITY_DN108310_c0_g1~~TRINITY_DN108310_c0_g1_i1.p1  ORF type:complete len:128 (+),score=10.17 TRINITY_DN108310_c0_g1_i1:253-636(+)